MIRGIKFEVPHCRYPVFNLILHNIDIKKFFWILVEEDVHKGLTSYFKKDRYSGDEFEQAIKDEDYYAVLINLHAYLKEEDFSIIKSYNEFLKSKCELILFINDNVYVDIYAKGINLIDKIKDTAKQNNFKNIEYITESNDLRTGRRGFSA